MCAHEICMLEKEAQLCTRPPFGTQCTLFCVTSYNCFTEGWHCTRALLLLQTCMLIYIYIYIYKYGLYYMSIRCSLGVPWQEVQQQQQQQQQHQIVARMAQTPGTCYTLTFISTFTSCTRTCTRTRTRTLKRTRTRTRTRTLKRQWQLYTS